MDEQNMPRELERRAFIKRAGVAAGVAVWAPPTIQSLTASAFAAGTPNCPPERLIRFKYDVETGVFSSDLPAEGSEARKCLEKTTGYLTAGGTINPDGTFSCGRVTVRISDDGMTATVTVEGGTVVDIDIKGGSTNSPNGHCTDGEPAGDGSTAVVDVPDGMAEISFVGGVICPSC